MIWLLLTLALRSLLLSGGWAKHRLCLRREHRLFRTSQPNLPRVKSSTHQTREPSQKPFSTNLTAHYSILQQFSGTSLAQFFLKLSEQHLLLGTINEGLPMSNKKPDITYDVIFYYENKLTLKIYNCERARKSAITGYFQGTQLSNISRRQSWNSKIVVLEERPKEQVVDATQKRVWVGQNIGVSEMKKLGQNIAKS